MSDLLIAATAAPPRLPVRHLVGPEDLDLYTIEGELGRLDRAPTT